MASQLTIKTYAKYHEKTNNIRASLRIAFTEVASRDPFGPEIPDQAYKVTFYDQPEPCVIEGRTATFEPENYSPPIFIGDMILLEDDLKSHFQNAPQLSDYYQEQMKKYPDAEAIVKTKVGDYEVVQKGEEVRNTRGQTIWPPRP